MEQTIRNLESRQKELLAQVNRDDFVLWLSMPTTKALLVQFEIDQLNLCQNWALGRYPDDKQLKAQGQAEYLDELESVVRNLWGEEDESV